jgi:hypothetical protein
VLQLCRYIYLYLSTSTDWLLCCLVADHCLLLLWLLLLLLLLLLIADYGSYVHLHLLYSLYLLYLLSLLSTPIHLCHLSTPDWLLCVCVLLSPDYCLIADYCLLLIADCFLLMWLLRLL